MSNESTPDPFTRALSGLGFRAIGPAVRGGRISDIAVHPYRSSTWYVAAGSGGVWKTTNAGTTWTPVFDHEGSFSIGCLAIDPTNPERIWVGTGEAVSGRHVAWGDGIYLSEDGGASWTRKGLEASEHIARILVDPRDRNVVHVAAEGPLWSTGGDRGVFTTRNGGDTWEQSLEIDANTGVTSLEFAPDDCDTLYAATYQRRRSVASFVGGGPGSGIHVSTDGGATWTKATDGLPGGEMGKIGLATTAADPDIVYATIETGDPKTKGCYRSTNRGRTWERRSDYISGGTGPHYYQEIFASPHNVDKVYQVDVFLHVTIDGGATFRPAERLKNKHADNHVVWIDPEDPNHLLVGCDAGLYETFDDCVTFRHFPNLPISQFYRIAVDDGVPFTTVLAGAQDLGTLAGPTRTTHVDGVRDEDWWVPLGADGYQAAFDPYDPDISYVEWQVGNILRHDRRTGEKTDIQPVTPAGDPLDRFNWDTPIVVSPHREGRIYVASQRVWRSDDRGDSWTPISGDLTSDTRRREMPVGEKVWSVDAIVDLMAMSWWATITCLSESPVTEGVLYAATDDGRASVSTDGGDSWARSGDFPGLPADAFFNDIEACRHRGDAVFAAADDHKNGDYTPYLFESTDHGETWQSIRGDLPDGMIIWQIEQDRLDPDLLFIAAENGLWASPDRGEHWHQLGKGPDGGGKGSTIPMISMRDLVLQRRDDDLVAASFGRGIYVLDDYSPLRGLNANALAAPGTLFPVRAAWRYVPELRSQAAGQPTLGSTAWRCDNPAFGAVVTYHLAEDVVSAKGARIAAEKGLDGNVPYPGNDALLEEHLESEPAVRLVIRAADGALVRMVDGPATAGLHRVAWDLRGPAPDPVRLTKPEFPEPWASEPRGPLMPAGDYTVELAVVRDGGAVEVLAGPEPIEVVDVPGVGAGDPDFATATAAIVRQVSGAVEDVKAARSRIEHLRVAIAAADDGDGVLRGRLDAVSRQIESVAAELLGDPVNLALEEPTQSISGLVGRVAWFDWSTTASPTTTQRDAIERGQAEFEPVSAELTATLADLAALTADIDAAGGPWTPR